MAAICEVVLTEEDVLCWACEKSVLEIKARIDDLITVILAPGDEGAISQAKFEASELAKILQRRNVL